MMRLKTCSSSSSWESDKCSQHESHKRLFILLWHRYNSGIITIVDFRLDKIVAQSTLKPIYLWIEHKPKTIKVAWLIVAPLLERPRTLPSPLSIVPCACDRDFVNRDILFRRIREKSSVPESIRVLVGLDGVGKSESTISRLVAHK